MHASRVVALDNLAQMVGHHLRIYGCRCQVRMPEKHLNRSQVCTPLVQMRCESTPEGMCREQRHAGL